MRCSIGGSSCSAGTIVLPASGPWRATLELPAGAAPSTGPATVTLGGRSLVGTVTRVGSHASVARVEVSAGAAGWGTVLARRGYASPAGVRIETVLSDLVRDSGEQIAMPATRRLGLQWARSAAPLSSLLDELARGWWVDDTGIAQLEVRAASTAPRFALLELDAALGLATVDSQQPELFVPGQAVVLAGQSHVVDSVEHDIATQRTYLGLVLVAQSEGRLVAALRGAVDRYSRARWAGAYRYRVVSAQDGLAELEPSSAVSGMPPLSRVPLRLPPGMTATPRSGATVVVQFLDLDPGQPYVSAYEAEGGEWECAGMVLDVEDRLTQTVDVGAAAGEVVRYGDTVAIVGLGPAAGVIGFTPGAPPFALPSILRG